MNITRLLQRHPFPVVANFERVVALSFAFPEVGLAPLVPRGLRLDSHEGFGFVTIALVWTKDLRPKGFPQVMGNDFFLAGYRIFTRLLTKEGRRLRGLKILRSETDKSRMVALGNLMTGYNYRQVKSTLEVDGSTARVMTHSLDGIRSLNLEIELNPGEISPPAGSPFADWKTARRFSGPMPFTFSPQNNGSFVVIEGSRNGWIPRPVLVKNWSARIFDEAPFSAYTPILANAFAVENISYEWQKGRIMYPKEIP
jgi:Uncharacterized conserved protein (COG2071)